MLPSYHLFQKQMYSLLLRTSCLPLLLRICGILFMRLEPPFCLLFAQFNDSCFWLSGLVLLPSRLCPLCIVALQNTFTAPERLN